MKLNKTFWIIVSVLIVALLVAAKWFGGSTEATTVQIEQANVRTIVERVSASGKIQPEVEVNITAEVSGQIIALPVKEGDQVDPRRPACSNQPGPLRSCIESRQGSSEQRSVQFGLSPRPAGPGRCTILCLGKRLGTNAKAVQ